MHHQLIFIKPFRSKLLFSLLLLYCLNINSQLQAQSPYISIKLSNGIVFDLPKNWRVFDMNTRTTLEAFAYSKNPIKINSELPFAANFYNSNNQTIGIMNIRVYPGIDVSQNEVIHLFDSTVMKQFNEELRNSISEGVKLSGGKVVEWYGTKKVQIKQKIYLLTKYKRRSALDRNKYFKVSLLRLLDRNSSFTLTTSYDESNEFLLKPITNVIINSIETNEAR